ncbi:MAG TPA: aminotransferase class I/II-fold pyridoxal phosphate-dependent enzyme [Trebonia sp.]
MREACRTAPNAEFHYGDPRGSHRLREVLAAYRRRVRAMDVDPGQVLVCTGARQGLGLVLRALAARGVDRVAFEFPGEVTGVPAAVRWAGLAAVPVAVDEQGIDVAAFDTSGAAAVLVTPVHQWPTGIVLAAARRLELVAWAVRRGAVIIEDDYDAEFRYDREPVGSLQGLAPDHVVTRHRQQVPGSRPAAGLDRQPLYAGRRPRANEGPGRPRLSGTGPDRAGRAHRGRAL